MANDKKKSSLVERFVDRQAGTESGNLARAGVQDQMSSRPTQGRTRNYAELNLKKLASRGFVTPDRGRSQIVEEFRAIKRPLLLNAFETDATGFGNNHVIMVTSTEPNEGKTFVAISLAMSIASEKGLNVLLIDADVVKRDLPKQLGFREKRGFLDLLVDENLSVSDVIVRTNIPNLSVLPAGDHEQHATELLASPDMKILMNDIAHRYSDRVIIIDTPPILLSSETSVLSRHVGQVVVVVESENTQRQHLENAVGMLGERENVNLVLNRVRDSKMNSRYGSFGGYYTND